MKMGIIVLVLILSEVTKAVKEATKTTLNETCLEDGIIWVTPSSGGVLITDAYAISCPNAQSIIFSWVQNAVLNDPRMAASLLRLHFHDCFVGGCDASLLLDDTKNFVGEKTAAPNMNSLRGFEVIDAIKSELESVCPGVVSCADILAVAARDSVLVSNGPSWEVQTGRKDSLTASKQAANKNIPGPNSTAQTLVNIFQNVGLSLTDMVALTGAHTLGKAQCSTFNSRLQTNNGDINLDFLQSLQQLCSIPNRNTKKNTVLANLDLVTPATFDNQYYVNLLSGQGLLPSDQALLSGDIDQTGEIVRSYAEDEALFFDDFSKSMLKMGSIGILTENNGEIRRNCRVIN
ncbi:peroxidase 40 [Amaranthus tricolor]|uniref:peroxidase 40 n=1 Tax=Amaranthus tricolor TaxID=29722 RepID=UPI002587BE4C|nr:peroxidase 40 [Amaranthus tricolor]